MKEREVEKELPTCKGLEISNQTGCEIWEKIELNFFKLSN